LLQRGDLRLKLLDLGLLCSELLGEFGRVARALLCSSELELEVANFGLFGREIRGEFARVLGRLLQRRDLILELRDFRLFGGELCSEFGIRSTTCGTCTKLSVFRASCSAR
jgi:hypothetical protein